MGAVFWFIYDFHAPEKIALLDEQNGVAMKEFAQKLVSTAKIWFGIPALNFEAEVNFTVAH